jgi:hypothetical protein
VIQGVSIATLLCTSGTHEAQKDGNGGRERRVDIVTRMKLDKDGENAIERV